MRRRHGPLGDVADERVVQDVDLEVQDVELVGSLANLVEPHDVIGRMILDRGVHLSAMSEQQTSAAGSWNRRWRDRGPG